KMITTLIDPTAAATAQINVADATIEGGTISMTANATTTIAVAETEIVGETTFALAIARQNALVSIDGASSITRHTDSDSSGNVTFTAIADVTGLLLANSAMTGSTNLDVTAAIIVIESSAVVRIQGTTDINSAGAL